MLIEEKKEQEKQWKRMKLGFYLFGFGGVGFSVYSLYELAQPEIDAEGERWNWCYKSKRILNSYLTFRQPDERRIQWFANIWAVQETNIEIIQLLSKVRSRAFIRQALAWPVEGKFRIGVDMQQKIDNLSFP